MKAVALDQTFDEHGSGAVPSTIVIPIDGAHLAVRALDVGRRWATTFSGGLLVVMVEGEHELAAVLADTAELHTEWRTVPNQRDLVPAVLDAVASNPMSAVCVATRAHSPLVDVVLDEIAQEILRAVEVPVLLVGPHCRTEALDGPVVVAHDGSRGELAALVPAQIWAKALDRPLVLLHVAQPLGVGLVEAERALEESQRELGAGVSLEIVRSSFPAGAIREYVHEVDAPLLALTTRGRTDTLTASTGRSANWVVRESPCPVLVAHPPAAPRD